MDKVKLMQAVRLILEAIGEEPDREGLRETPRRVAAMYEEMFAGLTTDPAEHLEIVFHEPGSELVIVKEIPFYSMCEHHLVPFFGKAHIAYLPRDGQVTGLSKLARLLEGFAKRPQVQERLTRQVADALMASLDPVGALVVIEAEHMCMTMRGVQKPGSQTLTSAARGLFEQDRQARAEAMRLIQP